MTRGLAYAVVVMLCIGAGWACAGSEGSSNTLYGTGAGNSLGDDDDGATFIGYQAGYNTTEGGAPEYGRYNTFVGYRSGYFNSTGCYNTFLGYGVGLVNTTGNHNTFLGTSAGISNTTGGSNTFVGDEAGYTNSTGTQNTFLGVLAGYSNTTGYYNTFLGMDAGYSNTTGYYNTFLGMHSGHSNTTGSGNVFLGYRVGYSETGSNRLYIDNSATSTPLIYGEFDTNRLTINGNLQVIGPDNGLVRLSNVTTDSTTKVSRMVLNHYSNAQLPLYLFGAASTSTANFVALGGGAAIANAATQLDLFTAPNNITPVGIPRLTIISDGNVGIGTQTPTKPLQMASGAHVTAGGAWTNASSREYKDNIRDLRAGDAMEALLALNPVTFNYKASANENHVGFIAEEVPDLVATKDRKGLSPMDIVAVLTKVVQEQQKVVQEQQRTAGNQQKTIDEQQTLIHTLTAKLAQLEAKLEALQK